ncbi:hypothetical protein SVI_0057 [Shewanella violacea DSS12]|uniref:Uncharacterized protein n=1 Tax=Shewanella violacea (strain JCM 10179 / CIP 106290 / LMG 19151 / DSS12) TaxID=637905 RepID=D4ZDA6_SHEVD|nr:hypothetical protein SVI_0057 [Shewanella violacea DSS12]
MDDQGVSMDTSGTYDFTDWQRVEEFAKASSVDSSSCDEN